MYSEAGAEDAEEESEEEVEAEAEEDMVLLVAYVCGCVSGFVCKSRAEAAKEGWGSEGE